LVSFFFALELRAFFFSVSFGEGPRSPYWVLSTDYETYAAVYSCTDLGNTQTEFAWILSRKRTLNAEAVTKLMNLFESFGIDTSHFEKTPQEGCKPFCTIKI